MPWIEVPYQGHLTIDPQLRHTCGSHPLECSHWFCSIGHACMAHCPCERCQSSSLADPRTKMNVEEMTHPPRNFHRNEEEKTS